MAALTAQDVRTLTICYSAIVGLAIGSFLNVVIYRVPRALSVIRPRSSCPECHTFIASRDNVPLVGWVLLRGKCRTCHSPISVRYPLIELATAALFALTAWRVGPQWPCLLYTSDAADE